MNRFKTFILSAIIIFASYTICEEEAKKDLKFLEPDDILEKFEEFMKFRGKSYHTIEEFNRRFAAFKANFETSTEKTISKLSKFMDLSKEEFANIYLKMKPRDFKLKGTDNEYDGDDDEKDGKDSPRNLQNSPASFDWRDKGIVSSIKEQGECGVCWAFSALANIESLYAIKNGSILDLSEEQLLDCDNSNDGCNGGLMDSAYDYIKRVGGVMKESDYRYTKNKDTCKFKKNQAVVTVTGWKNAGTKNEDKIKDMLVKYGPLAVGIHADNMQNYTGGIIDESASVCPPSKINHAVNLVGYGEQNGKKFWIVKNSWGEDWGEMDILK